VSIREVVTKVQTKKKKSIGVMAGLQFFDRMLLFLMPSKYQPNYVYLKYVRLSRVHLYTIVQVLQLLITSGVTR
jgi:hypothetical protein